MRFISKGLVWAFLCLILSNQAFSQAKYTISGYVKDAANGEEIIGATIYIEEVGNGAISNPYGFYSITLPSGQYTVRFSSIGYGTIEQKVDLNSNKTFNIELAEHATELNEVVVTGEAEDHNITEIAAGRNEISINQVKELPALFGEPDIIKNVQMQPGVITAGEGTSAFFVRGGSADQNLILIDEAPVYDPSHFFGLFSVFNADVLKSADLYKGGIPSKYGGRLSSMLDVRTKDGNTKKLAGSAGVGLLASKLMLEGPIGKNEKSSFLLSGRRSYADVVAKAAGQNVPVYFYDVNAKVNWKPSNKDRLFLSTYLGRDVLRFSSSDDSGIDWGNQTTTLRWNHLFNERLFSNATVIFSNFDYALNVDDEVNGFKWTANMQELGLKYDLNYFLNANNDISFGFQGTYRRFSPGRVTPSSDKSIFTSVEMPKMYSIDYAFYLGNTQKLTNKLSLEYGVRLSIFQNVGRDTIRVYENIRDNVNINVIEEIGYDRFEPIKTFYNFEPRFSARYILTNSSSVKASYQRMVQYIHLIANSTVPIPFNTWAPSSPYLDPQKADQIAIGYFKNFTDNKYEFSAEVYYKEMQNVTDFADNTQVFLNQDLATEYRQGISDSYGVELLLKKNKGKLTGFVGYTWSKTEREVPDVNNNMPFLANYDRRHNLNMVATYKLTDRYTLGGSWVYNTGRPITLPTGRYEYDGYNVNYYSERNGYKMPDNHRLDLSFTIYPRKNAQRKWKTNHNFSLYNAYNRRNPFTIYTRTRQDDEGNIIGDGTEKEVRMVALFPILPSYTFNINF